MKAEARHGYVVLGGMRLTPDEAADLLVEIAQAIQHTGDICEDRRVVLHEEVAKAVKDFKEEQGDG